MDGLDAGSITTMKGASIGYLPQEGLSLSGRTSDVLATRTRLKDRGTNLPMGPGSEPSNER
jgi:hypothetical protein